MALTIFTEDSPYKYNACRNILNMKKGQLMPPRPRCGGQMVKSEGGAPPQDPTCCSEDFPAGSGLARAGESVLTCTYREA